MKLGGLVTLSLRLSLEKLRSRVLAMDVRYHFRVTEKILKEYLEGNLSAELLETDINGSRKKTGFDTYSIEVICIDDDGDFLITPDHLLKLCQDSIVGNLDPRNLSTISFALNCSEFFYWGVESEDGFKIVEDVLAFWDEDISQKLTIDSLVRCKQFLLNGNPELLTENSSNPKTKPNNT